MRKKSITIFLIIFYLVLAGLIFSGCDGGGDDPAPVTSPTSHIPEISNLQYSPQTATQNQGNGTVSVTGTINFTDQGGDIAKVTINKYDANNKLLSTDQLPVQNKSGVVSGSINISGNVDTSSVATYRFEMNVTDLAGNSSNTLSGTFSVIAAPPPPAPSYSGTWKGMLSSPQTGSTPTTLILSQSGNSVSGTWDGYAVTGTVSGNQLTLTFTPFTQSGVSFTGSGSATVTGNSMSGTMFLTGASGGTSVTINGTFTLTRSVANALYSTDDAPAGGFVATAVDAAIAELN